jgi:porin
MKKIILALPIFVSFSYSILAQEILKNPKRPLSFEASYIGDHINNLSGGIKTGSCYLGMANIHLDFDFEKAGLWSGGEFYINSANTHGASPSSELLGDVQVASNIDAGNHTYLQEVWFKQAFGKIELTIGLQDLNVEFANSENGALYMNSSFGILPVISGNITPPIFPLTALGLTAKWNISENATWINALYDGSPTDFDYNPYNVRWQFISGDGLLAVSEYQYKTTIMGLSGTYKIGGYVHSHIIEESLHKNIPDSIDHTIYGLYTYTDQKLWQNNTRSIDLFAQLGYSPCNSSTNDFYLGLGVNYSGLFSKKGADILGLAIAHEHFKDGMKSETVVELTYHYPLTSTIFIQPDFQYIINPAGTGITLRNCLAMNLRFGFSF